MRKGLQRKANTAGVLLPSSAQAHSYKPIFLLLYQRSHLRFGVPVLDSRSAVLQRLLQELELSRGRQLVYMWTLLPSAQGSQTRRPENPLSLEMLILPKDVTRSS